MSKPIRIHSFALSGHSHRVTLFAALAGIPHQLVPVDLAVGEHKTPQFLALNPAGQVPVIEDGEIVVSDSNAILVYLAMRYAPDYLPTEPCRAAEVQKFLSLAAGEIAFGPAAARRALVFNAAVDRDGAVAIAERVFAKLEAHLRGRRFLVADRPSIADVAIYSYTRHSPEGGISLQLYPHIQHWLTQVEALPGFVPMPVSPTGLAA